MIVTQTPKVNHADSSFKLQASSYRLVRISDMLAACNLKLAAPKSVLLIAIAFCSLWQTVNAQQTVTISEAISLSRYCLTNFTASA